MTTASGGGGLLLDSMFTDVGSGLSTKQRPEFIRMRQHALDAGNRITDVVFWDLDRFTRNIEDFFTYTKALINAGITLHLAVEGEQYDYNSEEKWHQSQGPTRCHSSPNPMSGLLKCGECKTPEHRHNLELHIHRKYDVTRLRCSKKKKMGADAC